MEKEIINIMTSRGLNKIHLNYLIDLGDYIDCEGEVFAITCDTLTIKDNQVIIFDSNNENEDGSVDNEDIYYFNKLNKEVQKQAFWCLEETLKYWDRD